MFLRGPTALLFFVFLLSVLGNDVPPRASRPICNRVNGAIVHGRYRSSSAFMFALLSSLSFLSLFQSLPPSIRLSVCQSVCVTFPRTCPYLRACIFAHKSLHTTTQLLCSYNIETHWLSSASKFPHSIHKGGWYPMLVPQPWCRIVTLGKWLLTTHITLSIVLASLNIPLIRFPSHSPINLN